MYDKFINDDYTNKINEISSQTKFQEIKKELIQNIKQKGNKLISPLNTV